MTGINLKASAKVVGWLLILEAAMLLMPAAVSLIYGGRDFLPFILAAGITAFSGVAVSWPLHRVKIQLRRREGYLLTAIVWVLFSLFGMIPFLLCDHPLSVADAYFETMSGFTTTGATVISDVESCSHAILFWRALMQWLGGLGIVLFLLALLPALNQSGGITMYNAETTGITHDKLHPRIRQTAGSLWQLYGILTVMLIFLLWLGPMDIFDAVCQSLAAISTGGFSTRNSSIAAWNSSYVNAVITLFMFVAGVNFVLLYGAIHGRARDLFRNDVFRSYLGIVLGAFLIISIFNMAACHDFSLPAILFLPMFHVVSAVTSTGFSAADFSLWGPVALQVTLLLMAVGACAGSTTGGLKVDRIVALFRNLHRQIRLTLYPNHVIDLEVGGKRFSYSQLAAVSAVFTLFLIVILTITLILASQDMTLADALFATVSCVGNNGLGHGATASGFGDISPCGKWLLSAGMLLGRLEFFTVIAILTPAFWRK